MLVPKKYNSLIVAAVLLVFALAVLSYSAARLSETGFLRKMVLEAAAPVEGILNMSLKGLHNAWNRYLFLVGLEEENRQLRRKNAALGEQLNLYREGYIESLRLQKLFGLAKTLPGRTVAARVVDRNRTSLFKTIVIDKGTADGLRVGLPVLSEEGVVGRIIETAWHASQVLLLIDENSNIDAVIQRSRATGLVEGRPGGKLVMTRIPHDSSIAEGDIVLTSGLGGTFPKALIIGQVSRVIRSDVELFLQAEIRPTVDFNGLERALVITNFTAAATEESNGE